MAVFTKLSNISIQQVSKEFGEIKEFKPLSGGTDNSVYYFETCEGKYVYKLYEGKNKRFIQRLLGIHDRINSILSHNPLLRITEAVSGKVAIVFNYLESYDNYDINEILLFINIFHDNLNKGNYRAISKKELFFESLTKETEHYSSKIISPGYIDNYTDVDFEELLIIFKESLSNIFKNNDNLLVGYIHNDLNKGNILCLDDGIEFIDFDGVNKNLKIKDYIIFIIRFNLFNRLDDFFIKKNNDKYIIGGEEVSYNLIVDLYKLYSIYLIINMVYYIGYDDKDVKDEMYGGENQDWKDIYKNLQNNNIV